MLFDSDFNGDTGYQGIDYQVEVKWNNDTKNWSRSFNEFSSNGDVRHITPVINNYTGFFEKGSNAVRLYADLEPMLFPSRYRVFFYAYSQQGNSSLLDAVRWAYIPPPEFTISTIPKTVNLSAGEQKNIEVQVNSTTGFEPIVHFKTSKVPPSLTPNFTDPTMPVPSYGLATTTLNLGTKTDASIGPHTFFILANITFLNSTFISPIVNPKTHKGAILQINSTDVKKEIPFLVTIQEPISLPNQLRNWLSDWFNPVTGIWTTITTIATGVLGWRVWRKSNNSRGQNISGANKKDNL